MNGTPSIALAVLLTCLVAVGISVSVNIILASAGVDPTTCDAAGFFVGLSIICGGLKGAHNHIEVRK